MWPRWMQVDERGFSLVEMLVVTVLFGMVGAFLASTVIGVQRGIQDVDGHGSNQGHVRSAISAISRDLRTAAQINLSSVPSFRVAGEREAEFTANLRELSRLPLMRLYVDAQDRVVEEVTSPTPDSAAPDLVYDPADARARVVARYLVNDADEPLFRYFDAGGAQLDPGPDGYLDAVQRARIATIGIHLEVSTNPGGRSDATEVTTRVRIPNRLEMTS